MSEQQPPGPPPPGPPPPGQPPPYAPPPPPPQGYPPQGQPYAPHGQPYAPQGQPYPQQYPPQIWAPQQLLPPALAGKQFADYGQRVAAWLIDVLFAITIVGYFINWFLLARQGEKNGMSLGKQVVKIRVFRESGEPVTIGFAILREFVVRGLLFAAVGFFFLGLPGLLDLLWPLWDERNQCLHDKIVSSYVIKADEQPPSMIATPT